MTHTIPMTVKSLLRRSVAPAFCLIVPLASATGPTIAEPSTAFWGRVYNRVGNHAELLSEGTLVWTVSDGTSQRTFTAGIGLDVGQDLYRVDVPHSLLANGLAVAEGTVPVAAAGAAWSHASILVDGVPAILRAPAQHTFAVGGADRAASHRLDLEISRPFADADGDALPDWWEARHALDPQQPDATSDADGDGVSNLAEYRASTDPTVPNDVPQIVSEEAMLVADGTSALVVDTRDSDTPPDALVHEVVTLSEPGALRLRRPGQPERTLAPGDTFTLADSRSGALVWVHAPDSELAAATLELRATDGTPGHAAASGRLAVHFFRPEWPAGVPSLAEMAALARSGAVLPGVAADDQFLTRMYLMARETGALAWPLGPVASAGELSTPVPAVFHGGVGDDHFTGSDGPDVLAGAAGNDVLRGAAGPDRFVVTTAGDGDDILADFAPAEGDVIELPALFTGSTDLRSHVRLTPTATGTRLSVNFAGDPVAAADVTLTLASFTSAEGDLFTLFHGGSLRAPGLTLPTAVSVLASAATTGENGGAPGKFTLTRRGPLELELAVTLSLSGSATNGVDYALLAPVAVFAPGQATVDVLVTPYADAVVEPAETVRLTLVDGAGYIADGNSAAQLVIEDLVPEISLETLEPLAVVDQASPAVVAVHRTGALDRSLLVRLQVAGNATPDSDYQRLPSFISLAANQTSALVNVTPRPDATLAHGVECVQLTVAPQAAYRTAAPESATVFIVPAAKSLERWRTDVAPGNAGSLDAFLAADPGQRGLPNMLRYAFGLDALAPQNDLLPQVRVDGGHLCVDFAAERAARDVEWTVEFSTDASHWVTGAAAVQEMPLPDPADARWSRWRARRAVSDDPTQFLRVRVNRRP